MKPDPKANHVKILVYTAAEDGYPPEEWESLWAIPMGDSLFKIDNIPFFAKGLSCDDVVSAAFEGDTYIFSEVVTPSDNSTVRVLVFDSERVAEIRAALSEIGCESEGSGIPGLFSMNIPKNCQAQAYEFLRTAASDETLDYEEGAAR
jgi:hypothetical protein